MPPRVRLKRGIECTLDGGERVVFDGSSPGETTVLSHAHSDHLVRATEDPVVASDLTAALAATRNGGRALPNTNTHPDVDLLPAGHIYGSRAALLTDPDTGTRVLYTGDCSTRSRHGIQGFDPPSADVLVIETTYGEPRYRFPSDDELLPEIHDWLQDTMDAVVLLFGYALGRGQTLQHLAAAAGRTTIYVPDTVAQINATIEAHRDVTFASRPLDALDTPGEVEPGDAIVLPSRARRHPIVQGVLDRPDTVTAGFSGWAIDDSYYYRTGHDATFPLSDHCDFDELVDVVRAVDPDVVYTTHGSTDEFASHLTREHGYRAQALRKHQATLDDY